MPHVPQLSRMYHRSMNLGMPEMIFIFVLALIIFGPRKLPEIGREIGKALAELKRASNDFQNQLQNEIEQVNLEEERKKFKDHATALMEETQAGFSIKPPEQSGVARTLSDAGVTEADMQMPQTTAAAANNLFEQNSILDPAKSEMKAPNVQ